MTKNTDVEPLAINIMMLVYGFSVTAVGALLPVFLADFGISAVLGGAIAGAQGLGGISTIFMSGTIADRLDKPRAIAASFGAYAVSLLCAALIGSYAALLAVFFSIGVTTRLLDAFANARASDISGENRSKRLSLLHAAFGIGALLGPLYLQSVSSLAGWRAALASLGVIAAGITLWFVIAVLRGASPAERSPDAAAPPGPVLPAGGSDRPRNLLSDRAVWLLIGVMAFYSVHQAGVSVWLPSFLAARYKMDAALANAALSLYWAAIVAGRLTAYRVSGETMPRLVLVRGAIAAAAALTFGLLLDSAPALIAAIAFTGFASGAVIPALISTACAAHPEASGSVSSTLFVTSSAVRIVIPSAIGVAMIAFGARAGFGATAVALAGCAGAAGAALSLLKSREEERS